MDNAACVQTVPGDTNIMSRKARYFAHRTFLRLNVLIYFFHVLTLLTLYAFALEFFYIDGHVLCQGAIVTPRRAAYQLVSSAHRCQRPVSVRRRQNVASRE